MLRLFSRSSATAATSRSPSYNPEGDDAGACICPICLSSIALPPRGRRRARVVVLECCGHAFCKQCLENKEHVVDWCPMCRSFVPHFHSSNGGGRINRNRIRTQKWIQAKRLVANGASSASLDKGIALLEELRMEPEQSFAPKTRDSVSHLEVQLTLARSLIKRKHEDQAVRILQDAVVESEGKHHPSSHRRLLAQAHFLLGELYQQQSLSSSSPALYQQQYDRAVALDPQNVSLLMACARNTTTDKSKAFQYNQLILQVNKYHLQANLWLADYYRYSITAASTMTASTTTTTTTTTATLTSYLACIVRSEYKLSCQTQQPQRERYVLQCQQHRNYLQREHADFYTQYNSTMDRISAAFVPVIEL